ncbi:hypothetical protein RchiOBHm_Chr2g0085791 [Rosa chinensis]|uniref:Uncharacterized protein n=1 Tax=Rosa chinensis TaxID=74649 RepID=A0A2P6RI73_ROSCH|nr:hypothetical protein RchiOBHm_Chr2g0085791 [Rosa chinensis]
MGLSLFWIAHLFVLNSCQLCSYRFACIIVISFIVVAFMVVHWIII